MTLTRLEVDIEGEVMAVSSSDAHTLCVLASGKAYGWGCTEVGVWATVKVRSEGPRTNVCTNPREMTCVALPRQQPFLLTRTVPFATTLCAHLSLYSCHLPPRRVHSLDLYRTTSCMQLSLTRVLPSPPRRAHLSFVLPSPTLCTHPSFALP